MSRLISTVTSTKSLFTPSRFFIQLIQMNKSVITTVRLLTPRNARRSSGIMILYYISLSCFTTDFKHLHYQSHDKLLLWNHVILRHKQLQKAYTFLLKQTNFKNHRQPNLTFERFLSNVTYCVTLLLLRLRNVWNIHRVYTGKIKFEILEYCLA